MPDYRVRLAGGLVFALCLASGWPQRSLVQTSAASPGSPSEALTITNLGQLHLAFGSENRIYANVRLEVVVCTASKPDKGVVVAKDSTGVELLELGRRPEALLPGAKIRIEGNSLLLRRRELGTQISAPPLVSNDGLHMPKTASGEVMLKSGPVPLELDWFNGFRYFGLEVSCQQSNGLAQKIPDSALWHAPRDQSPGTTNLMTGLRVECYEGYFEQVPDFDLLQPVKVGTMPNFDIGFRTQDEMVGLRYTGFFEAPTDGQYTFKVTSDDGSLFFLGLVEAPVRWLGACPAPVAQAGLIGQPMNDLEDRRWMSVAGRVSFVSRRNAGLELELRSGADTLSVTVVDAAGLDPAALLNAYVRASGVSRAALSASQRVVLDRFFVVSGADLQIGRAETEAPAGTLPLIDISQVQTLQIQDAKRELPVRVRGVVTAANHSDRWVSLQDDTRGIFVDLHALSNAIPARGDLYEVTGRTAPGNFAPVIVANTLNLLGRRRMPEPAHPSWGELANGSRDVQWVEFQGLVSEVHSNAVDLLLPEGPLQVRLEDHFTSELNQYQHAVVRIRGTLFAIWNADTREVQFGSLLMRGASVSVDTPPPSDPFDAPVKTARQLLLFDARATAFRPVKVGAQVLYTDARRLLAADKGMGLRVVPVNATALMRLMSGDLIEAVGYPEIGGPSLLLRQALVRKTGVAPLPRPAVLAGLDLARKGFDSTLVQLEALLVGMHSEQNSLVLELQSNGRLFITRIRPGSVRELPLRLGSKLQLCGVLSESALQLRGGGQVERFELLVNSPADIEVLSQPSWWTLPRLAGVVGLLLVALALAAAWIHQLRRQVEQRTAQLQREIHDRERAERHHALEAERSRIARDLHDDLGSSLTEIGVLASTGQRANGAAGGSPELFNAIAGKARGSIAALDVIVWAVDPEDNSLQSVADYLSGYAADYLATSNVDCRFKIPVSLPAIMFVGQVRHDLFLAIKETLNNVVRHAQAGEVEFGIAVTEARLEIVIADNGKGFDPARAHEGNGLKNLRGRLARLGGSCAVESQIGRGTTVRIRLSLPVAEVRPECTA